MSHPGPPPPPPPGQFRPPPPPPGGQPPRPQGGQGPAPGQFMPLPIRQPLQQSVRIRDLTPPIVLNEAACLKKLTTYAAYTIRKVTPRSDKDKPTWAKAEVVEEKYPQEEVLRQIKKLTESKRTTVYEKKSALAPFQQGQITSLLDDLGSGELDPAFEWSLVQLETNKKPVSTRSSGKKLYETVTMTVYVKRAPARDVNPIQLYQILERIRADRLKPPPPPQIKPQQQPQQQGGGQGHPGGNQQRPPPPPPGFVQINKGGPQGGNPNKPQIMKQQPQKPGKQREPMKYHGRKSSSSSSDSDSSDSDTGSGSSSESDSMGTSISSQSKHRRRPSKGASRRHSVHRDSRPKYYLEARSSSPPRNHQASDAFGGLQPQHRPYVPEVPRAGPTIDPLTSAYQAGREDVMAERFGADRFAQKAQQIAQPVVQVIERIIEPKSVVSYGRPEVNRYADRPRVETRYIDDRYVDDLRSIEDDYIVNGAQRRAEGYIDRRPIDFERRPLEPREPRHFFEQRPRDFEPRPRDFEQRTRSFERRQFEESDFERRFNDAPPPFERRRTFDQSPIRSDFRDQSPPRGIFPGSSHPFAPVALPRRYPPIPSSTSSYDQRGGGW